MARRPTITDVAEAAGVSVATVDRVLNGRARVREETARRVYQAAREIGYHAASLIGQRMTADLPEIRFGFVFHKERQAFWQAMRAAAEAAVQAAPGIRGRAEFAFATSQAPSEFARLMKEMARRCDVLAATAVAHHDVTEAVTTVQDSGTPCFALLNDFAQGVRHSYAGLNNLKAGRIAGQMLATAIHKPGKMAVFVGGYRWHGHELRETGFRSYLREFAPEFSVLDTMVNLETRQLTYEATLNLLDRQPDLRGLYCAGGGMEGAIAALREVRRPGDVAMVVHELTPESRAALADRYVTMAIATPLSRLFAETVSLMSAAAQSDRPAVPGQHFLNPDLYLPESI
ncbi:LacI family DNA-binding transcriptional regulator [Thetidibacter halocola]|uniref:LacI family DNA-binding transcriptional regulator n=1 Tax=Thetidibacter halocola TaxID=2827239 RepID=A0A8J7WI32_9RHOB|nr:LacI family DNA-binding transcriptional regulator [Thetidibacter halocola]MBS0125439.1 LacI family DNA-binding transcriptional regulator [Thetidibacter halocola]